MKYCDFMMHVNAKSAVLLTHAVYYSIRHGTELFGNCRRRLKLLAKLSRTLLGMRSRSRVLFVNFLSKTFPMCYILLSQVPVRRFKTWRVTVQIFTPRTRLLCTENY